MANAVVHRVWDTNSYIQIAMYEDKIELNYPHLTFVRMLGGGSSIEIGFN